MRGASYVPSQASGRSQRRNSQGRGAPWISGDGNASHALYQTLPPEHHHHRKVVERRGQENRGTVWGMWQLCRLLRRREGEGGQSYIWFWMQRLSCSPRRIGECFLRVAHSPPDFFINFSRLTRIIASRLLHKPDPPLLSISYPSAYFLI